MNNIINYFESTKISTPKVSKIPSGIFEGLGVFFYGLLFGFGFGFCQLGLSAKSCQKMSQL